MVAESLLAKLDRCGTVMKAHAVSRGGENDDDRVYLKHRQYQCQGNERRDLLLILTFALQNVISPRDLIALVLHLDSTIARLAHEAKEPQCRSRVYLGAFAPQATVGAERSVFRLHPSAVDELGVCVLRARRRLLLITVHVQLADAGHNVGAEVGWDECGVDVH